MLVEILVYKLVMDILIINLFMVVFSFKYFMKMMIIKMFLRDVRINISCCRQMKVIRIVEKIGFILVVLIDGMFKKENGEGLIYKCIMIKIL